MCTGRDERGVDPGITLQHGTQVAELPAGAAFDTQHVDLFIHNANAAFDAVVLRGRFVGERFDGDFDSSGSFFMYIDIEEDVLELQATFQ